MKPPEIDREIGTAIGVIELSYRDDSAVNMSHRKYSRVIRRKCKRLYLINLSLATFYFCNYQRTATNIFFTINYLNGPTMQVIQSSVTRSACTYIRHAICVAMRSNLIKTISYLGINNRMASSAKSSAIRRYDYRCLIQLLINILSAIRNVATRHFIY